MDQANQMPIQETPKKSAGPVIGIIIIVIVLVVGAFYFWGAKLNNQSVPAPETEQLPLSSSDEVENISADLNATAIDGIDESLDAIDAELGQ